MLGLSWGYLGPGFNFLIITVVLAILFLYVWLQSHGVAHKTHFHQYRVDAMAGDEGQD